MTNALFTTPEQRLEYFDSIQGGNVKYGTAKKLAKSVTLGFFSSNEMLRRDCAKILVQELVRFSRENPKVYWPLSPLTDAVECLLLSSTFQHAFNNWRIEKDYEFDVASAKVIQSAPKAIKRTPHRATQSLKRDKLYTIILEQMERIQLHAIPE